MLSLAQMALMGVLLLSSTRETLMEETKIVELTKKVEHLESELEGMKKQLSGQIDSAYYNNLHQNAAGSTCSSAAPPVYFFFSYPKPVTGAVDVIKFSHEFVNIGNAYNSVTGIFACPVTGVYQLFFSTNFGRREATNLWLVKDGQKVLISHMDLPANTTGNLVMALLELRKGSHVWVTQEVGHSWSDVPYHTIYFGGYLLHALPEKANA
ncbi:multimerin-2-like isoform X2 [Lepisosteus oculatus]|uniref:multimerin-2-like isoform X2 n=1 Tax=Lepisosteus oculatus TaxID=7918 RepID=UPI00073FBC2B|nr:PREDICTED: multimerin-2-like [Lepisosteus oculatus]